ncbi:hypothetical protein CK203_054489 [Vitis vinifera]|uniref:Uncharacterized protein n=1 Tax=Vitis vinifera TaxID=29760 RepID=A0A438GBC3_VITVI|nr:hypothetical protein CK203_054489 [Vitis vinifera]
MDPRKKQRSCKEGGSFSGSPECNPLRMVLADGRAVDLARLDISGADDWTNSSSAAFSKFLGMPTVGFEEETLALLIKMRCKREVKHREFRKGKRLVTFSKFDRELKRSETSINYGRGALRRVGRDKIEWELVLVCQWSQKYCLGML